MVYWQRELGMKIDRIDRIYVSKNKIKTTALKDVSYEFPERGMVFVVGKSGCGKTTLLNMLGGIDAPDNGRIERNGVVLNADGKSLDEYRKNEVSFLFQSYNLIDRLTVKDNLFITFAGGKEEFLPIACEHLKSVGLSEDVLEKYPYELSGGQQQRVALVRALMKPHGIVLADEPTGNLDSMTGKEIFDLLKKESEKCLVVVVTHDLENAYKYADELVFLEDGGITKAEKRAEIKTAEDGGNKSDKSGIKKQNKGGFNAAMLKLALSNFKSRTFTVILAVLLCMIAAVMAAFTGSIGNFDYSENVSDSIRKNGVQSFAVNRFNENEENYVYADLDAMYNTYGKEIGDTYKAVYHDSVCRATVYDLTKMIFGENSNNATFDNRNISSKYVIISNAGDLKKLFGTDVEFDFEGVYISDIYADLMYYVKESCFNENGEVVQIFEAEDYVGNFVGYNNPVRIGGIFKTDFYGKLKETDSLSASEKAVFLNDLSYKYFNFYGSESYLAYHRTMKTEFYSSDGDIITLSSGEKTYNAGELTSRDTSGEVFASANGITENLQLNENGIAISLAQYNGLFGTRYTLTEVLSMSESEIRSAFRFGTEISLQLESGNDSFIKNLTLLGVRCSVYDQGISEFDSVYVTRSVTDEIDIDKNQTDYLYVINADADGLEGILSVKGIQANGAYFDELRIYQNQTKETTRVFLIISVIMAVFFCILMYYVMSNIINSNVRNVGVLRSLGLSNGSCVAIFVTFALILAFIVCMLSCVAAPLWIYFTDISMAQNVLEGAVILRYDVFVVSAFVILPFAVSLLASVVPLVMLSRKKPIDIINRG